VVVPATPPHEHAFWTEGQAIAIARDRLDAALGRFHAEGLLATGDVGDANPVEAVSDVLRHEQFDEVIVSTLPPGLSRWIHQDLPRRLERKVELPVRHVIVPFDDLAPVGGRLEDAPR
jgi:cell pole-organizing protein PopZ